MRSIASGHREVAGRNAGRSEEIFAFSWCLALQSRQVMCTCLECSTPATADDTLFTDTTVFLFTALVWSRLALASLLCGARPVILLRLTSTTLLITRSLVLFELKLQNRGSIGLLKIRSAGRGCGEIPSTSISIRFANQKFISELHNVLS
jgi:hypothetical protein